MHDIGKIATPEHILDKATRLETLYDQIHTIKMRFNYVKYFLKSEMLETKCKFLNGEYQIHMDQVEHKYAQTIEELESDFDFVSQANLAFKVMSDDDIARIKDIGEKSFMIDGNKVNLLTEEEINYLSIRRGTLSEKEREKINEHAKTTQDMLKMITFPAKYDRVAEIASGHHEKLNGKGYPLGLKDYEISFETRMLAVVDILEALTAKDRPYKKAKTEEETFEILDLMVQKGELDGKLVNFIKEAGIFKKYIQKEVFQEVTA
jgi:response regulator RpfG family c-di-GMP phosphodiesterase